MDASETVVELANIVVHKGGQNVCCIDELHVAQSETVVVVGNNGAGKSTLLRVVAGLERDYQGHRKLAIASTECSYVHQQPFMFRGSVLKNATYGLRAHGIKAAPARDLAIVILGRLGIDKLDQDARSLSGGERRKLAIARVVLFSPKLLLLDEPFADLDEEGCQRVTEEIEALDATVLIAAPRAQHLDGARQVSLNAPGAKQ